MPSRKIGSAAVAGALSIVLVWAVKEFAHIEIPAEVGSAISAILSVGTGYLMPDPQ